MKIYKNFLNNKINKFNTHILNMLIGIKLKINIFKSQILNMFKGIQENSKKIEQIIFLNQLVQMNICRARVKILTYKINDFQFKIKSTNY